MSIGDSWQLPNLDHHPMYLFTSPHLTEREVIVKQEVDSYQTSDISQSACLQVGDDVYQIGSSVDLPDTICDGLTFKMRLIRLHDGDCYLLARWKPDRRMRRASEGRGQKWFLEKKLFPEDAESFLRERECLFAQTVG